MAKKKRIFAWSPLRNLMKIAGSEIVSRDAVEVLFFLCILCFRYYQKTALVFAKHSKRKKINSADLELAIETL